MKINRTELTVEPVKLICRYCETFRNSQRAPQDSDTKVKSKGRLCNGKIVFAKSPACENWECCKFISCDRHKFRIWTQVCVNRYQKKKQDCLDCSQGKEISKFI